VFDPEAATDEALVGSGDEVAELIARGRLTAVYQPIFELATGAVLGWEGLIRPKSPSPFPDPAALFAAAEAGGQLIALDFACVETIVAGAGDLPEGAFLSVNLSPKTLEAAEFSTAALLAILGRHGLAPGRLVIELTERQPIGDVERVLVKLDTFRRAGIRLAADHLGAGNAGLRLLTDVRFDIVKVDLGLVHKTAPGGRASAVVESIVAFASRTGALVVGEGVEDADQIDQLVALGVPAAQGYLLGRPGPLPESTVGESPAVAAIPELQAAARAVDEEMLTWRRSLGLPANPVLVAHKPPMRAARRTARASSTTSG
jgi:EAL domain-containing protein (putative c-di-GMP-specific phosphodiesterase class I)